MNYALIYLLLGSIGLNMLWMYQDKVHDMRSLLRGFIGGLVLGPITILIWAYFIITDINRKANL